MHMGNLTTSIQTPGTNRNGLGDLWSDIINAGTGIYSNITSQSISNSQAQIAQANADAQRAIAQSQAMQAQAASSSSSRMWMIGGGVALAGILAFVMMKRRRK